MVHEIVTGKRTWEDARRISEESTVAYNLGRSAPYAERLLFEVPQEGTEDLDEGGISGAVLRQAGGKLKDLITGSEEEARPSERDEELRRQADMSSRSRTAEQENHSAGKRDHSCGQFGVHPRE